MEISTMADRHSFEHEDTLKRFLAQQLMRGRLALVLGAGASFAFKLPNWDTLTTRVANLLHYDIPLGTSNEAAADMLLLCACKGDDVLFAEKVREALYQDTKTSMHQLTTNPLLVALGAMVMSSSRGSVAQVLSFNFDDMLELYLRYHGFVVEAVGHMPHWGSAADVRVFHIHGLLPNITTQPTSKIVFAQIHFDRATGRTDNPWRAPALSVLGSNTCIFLGLSGRDNNLKSLLTHTQELHPAIARGDAFWGIRLGCGTDVSDLTMWRARGVYTLELGSYDDFPGWLLDICQHAAEISLDHRGIR